MSTSELINLDIFKKLFKEFSIYPDLINYSVTNDLFSRLAEVNQRKKMSKKLATTNVKSKILLFIFI